VEEVELGAPRKGEVLVQLKAAGMCHSDEHLVTGGLFAPPEVVEEVGRGFLPMIGGHEGAGVVVEVGEGVDKLSPGDHVAASFIPSCGDCHFCNTGRKNLCDTGAFLFGPGMLRDQVDRHHARDKAVWTFCKLGTFAEHMLVSETSLVKIDEDVPFSPAALVSCGVATGWGSVVNAAEVRAGETVVVIGVGGVGINSVQAARIAGAARVIAVDPVEFKREMAQEFGATHTVKSMEEALPLVTDLTIGRLADKVIITVGEPEGEMIAPAMALVSKAGTLVMTAVASMAQIDTQLSLFDLTMFNKRIQGSIFGSGNPQDAIPELLNLYRLGKLRLDELVTRTYSLDQINEGYQDMRDGKNIRGVITFD
jgi:S-(hydroxymethyl)glutathione dehydrogenase/alcohol dehydrogenase